MFRVFCTANFFLVIGILKLAISNQESFSYANCQLTNTCFGRTTDDLANERLTTPKNIGKETTSNTQTTVSNSDNTTPLVSLQTADDPSTEATPSSKTTQDLNTALHTTTSISTATQLAEATNRNSEVPEVTKTSNIVKTADVYSISSIWKFDPPSCGLEAMIKVKDHIYVLCYDFGMYNVMFTIRAYEDSNPYDLLFIIIPDDKLGYRTISRMVGIENTDTLYLSGDGSYWKMDIVNNRVDRWLSRVFTISSLSAANNAHVLVVKSFQDPPYVFDIYDQEPKFVRSVLLPKDFKRPIRAIQKPNGEFIVSHFSEENNGMCVSFLSADGQIISQLRLREAVGFTYMQRFSHPNYGYHRIYFATDRLSGNVYMRHRHSPIWNQTDLSFIISNSSDESSREIVGFQSTDGRIFYQVYEEPYLSKIELFWDTDNEILFVAESEFGNLYLFDTKTLSLSKIRGLPYPMSYMGSDHWVHYDAKKNQIVFIYEDSVEIFALSKS